LFSCSLFLFLVSHYHRFARPILIKKDRGEKDEDVAIKRVSKQACKSEDDIQGLFDEVTILQKIHHPHVMRLHCFFEDAKFYSLVTELVVGGELFDRIVQKNHYNEKVARDLVRIFLETLDFLHTNGIVHRGFPLLSSLPLLLPFLLPLLSFCVSCSHIFMR
jgi:serine/threonine protein kinase